MEFKLNCLLKGENSQAGSGSDARCRLEEESLSILPDFGEALYFSIRDITSVSASDYRVRINLTSGETLVLSELGYKYEDFLRILFKIRNEMIIKDMLMQESVKKSGVEAEYTRTDESKDIRESGECRARLYETALVIIPSRSEILRIPYCYISGMRKEGYSLELDTAYDGSIILSRMGREFDPFCRALSDIINELSLKAQKMIKELLPEADPLSVRKVSGFMREGLAARRSDIDSVCPGLWSGMENRVKELENGQEYEYLSRLGRKDKICIGMKRGLMGDLTGEYLWFLIPIYSVEPGRPGNIVAMESVSQESRGSATYFFRLTGRKEYPGFSATDSLDAVADEFITKINRCMLAVNFRREPIYLPRERLNEPGYLRYRVAVSAIPELRELRELFVGRVIHRSPGQWKEDADQLMRFNAEAGEDSLKWSK